MEGGGGAIGAPPGKRTGKGRVSQARREVPPSICRAVTGHHASGVSKVGERNTVLKDKSKVRGDF